MNTKTTKSWPYILSGALLSLYSLIRLAKNISLLVEYPGYFSFSTFVQMIHFLILLTLGVTVLFKKKNKFTIILLGTLMLIQFYRVLEIFGYLFKWPFLYSLISFITRSLPIVSTGFLILIVVLSFAKINNLLLKFLWFVPGVIEFTGTLIGTIGNLLNNASISYYTHTVPNQLLYCTIILFLGLALKTPLKKKEN